MQNYQQATAMHVYRWLLKRYVILQMVQKMIYAKKKITRLIDFNPISVIRNRFD